VSATSTATPLTVLLTEGVRGLVDAGHTPAAVGVALRGPDQAVVTAGHRTHPRRGHIVPAAEVGPGTLFGLGSITKTFTTLLLAELAARGTVAYHDPIQAYLPPEAAPRHGTPAITLAHLATHSAGLSRLPRGLYRQALPRLRSDPYARYRVEDLHRATARLRPLREPPVVRYSTFGIGLLGHLLARAAGTPYSDLVAERILTPLGMRDTSIPDDDTLARHAACGHRRGRRAPHWHFDALAAAGALYSSGADMLCYLRAQLDPSIAPPPLAIAISVGHRPRRAYPRGSNSIALGWNVRTIQGRTLLWHSGGTGGFTAFIGFSPDAEAGVAVLTNTTPTLRQPVILAARRLLKAVVYG
jgi:CubicO group peptidase (beta-lactamase class C family)